MNVVPERPQRPPAVGSRFQSDGSVCRSPGNAVLCHITAGNPGFAAVVSIQRALQDDIFCGRFAFLPPASLHMTPPRGSARAGQCVLASSLHRPQPRRGDRRVCRAAEEHRCAFGLSHAPERAAARCRQRQRYPVGALGQRGTAQAHEFPQAIGRHSWNCRPRTRKARCTSLSPTCSIGRPPPRPAPSSARIRLSPPISLGPCRCWSSAELELCSYENMLYFDVGRSHVACAAAR